MKTTFSRRQLYALGEPLGDSATHRKADGGLVLGDGGGGGGGSSGGTTVTDLPEWAKGYAQETLGKGSALTDINQNPYKAYTGDRTAGFSKLQTTAQEGAEKLQTSPELRTASGITEQAALSGLGAGYQPGYFGNQFRAPGAYQTGQFGYLGAQAPDLQQFQMGPAERVAGGQYAAPEMAAAQTGYRPDLSMYQMGPAERVRTGSFTQPGVAERYMSPYIEQALAPQLREAQRASQIAGTQEAGQAVRSGAFGGSRAGLLEAERQRNLATQMGDIRVRGLQTAFEQAQGLYGTEAQRQLAAQQANQQAGLTVGGQNLAAALGVQQLGTQTGMQTALANLSSQQQANVQNQAAQLQTQGLNASQAMQAALANQQAGLNVGQQNLAAQLGIQQLGAGQNMQAQLANQQAYQQAQAQREASRQFGYGQQMTAAQQRAQFGQAAQQLGEQSRQFGAGYGLQGLQTALSGAGQLGNLGQQQFGQQKDILGLQSQFGQQQQALEQQRLSQRYQDFLNEERYPYQQLEFMSNLIRGTPMGTVQTMYNAPPSTMQTLGALGLGAYGAKQLFAKEGGTVNSYARGGSVTDDRFVAGALDRLSNAQLDQAEQVAKAEGDANRLRLIAEERATRASESRGLAGMYNSLSQEVQARMAGGGIVAFSGGGESSAADTINAAMDEAEGSEGSAADVINAAMASPGAPDRYGRSLDTLDALIAQMSEAKPEQLSREQLDDIINKQFALEQRLAGPAPYGDIQKFIGEAEADRPKALQQAKGLAALKAMSAIVQPGGFIRGLAGAGGAAGDVMDKAFQADRAEKRSLASMKFNMADAQRKERMGMTKSAMDAARQAQRDKLDAHKSHMQSLGLRAQAAARGAQAAKPTGQKGASEPKAVEQYGLALAEYKRNPTPENKIKMESWLSAVQESRDIGPDRLAAIMAGITGQRTAAELRADVTLAGQARQIDDKVLEARTRAQYSPAYLAAKTDADRAEVLRKAEADARAVYSSSAARPAPGAGPTTTATFDAQWAKLKKGQSLVGPDGKTYIKQ